MLPGQWGLFLIGLGSLLALIILGIFSYLAYDKEKKEKAKKARAERREKWHESMKATADDDLLGSFEQEESAAPFEEAEVPVADEEPALPTEEAPMEQEDFLQGFVPFDFPETKTAEPATEQTRTIPKPVPQPDAAPKRKSTRNDFDFKF